MVNLWCKNKILALSNIKIPPPLFAKHCSLKKKKKGKSWHFGANTSWWGHHLFDPAAPQFRGWSRAATHTDSCSLWFLPLNLQSVSIFPHSTYHSAEYGLKRHRFRGIQTPKNPVTPFHNSTAEIRSTPKAAVHCGNSWAFWREQGRLDRDSHQNPSPVSKKSTALSKRVKYCPTCVLCVARL